MIDKKYLLDTYELYIDDVPCSDYGALIESYGVGSTQITNDMYQGVNRTAFVELFQQLGQKLISINLFYAAPTRRRLAELQSRLDGLLTRGKVELRLPDGFFYSAVCNTLGDLRMLGAEDNQLIALCSYTFTGTQHDALVTSAGNSLYVNGSMPRMDCRLSCTASADHETLTLGTVTFSDIQEDDVVVADGMTGELSVNGEQVLPSFTRLPFVVPGQNDFDCPETLTVQYYPCWV